jgi:hypothetical protein
MPLKSLLLSDCIAGQPVVRGSRVGPQGLFANRDQIAQALTAVSTGDDREVTLARPNLNPRPPPSRH